MKILFTNPEYKNNPGIPQSIPFHLLNENWAYYIHHQSLEKLNSRGGMSLREIVVNMKRLDRIREAPKEEVDCLKFIMKFI